MNILEVVERNFTIDTNEKVIDDAGNEYRNENGEIEFVNEPKNQRELSELIHHQALAEEKYEMEN